jgi:hypothetical protein
MDFRPNLFRQFFILISFVAVIVSSTFLVLLWLVPTVQATPPKGSYSGEMSQTVANNVPNVLTSTTPVTSNVAHAAVTLFFPFLDSDGSSGNSHLNVTGMTQLYIETNTTGGDVAIEIRTPDASNTLKLTCTIPDETVFHQPCGSIPAGTYLIIANTLNCGQLIETSLLITGPEQTVPVSCGSFQGVWSGRINEYFAE